MSSQHTPKLALIALSFALGACSFSFQAGTSANTRAQKRPHQAAHPTAKTASTTKTSTTTTASTTKTTTTTAATTAPMINGTIAFGNGTVGAFKGLAYVIPSTTEKLPDLSKLVPFASLLTDSFIVQTQEFTAGFPGVLMQDEWFALRYDGKFDITKDATYTLRLVSDDGAILYIDGEKLVDNDGLHAARTVTNTKALKTGRHTLRLDYFQGARGPVALQLGIAEGTNPEQFRPLVGAR